jgi:CRP/FNR family cyclic AMP-dependent transcriptional regulator
MEDDLNFAKVTQSPIYDRKVALSFFQSTGKVETVDQGNTFFVENQKSNKLFMKSDKMYLLLDGEVSLTVRNTLVGTVRMGEIFGEMAAMSQLPRSATATAKSNCKVISLDDKQFQKALEKTPEFALMLMSIIITRLRETIARLSRTNSLASWENWNKYSIFERKLLDDLMHELEDRPPMHCPLNKVIMQEGEGGVFMYVVLDGRVAVSIKDTVVEKVGPGGVFGEMALVNPGARLASATAETDCTLIAINRNTFLTLVKSKPAFGLTLLKSLAERLRFMDTHIE